MTRPAEDPAPFAEEAPDRGRRLLALLSLPLHGEVLLHGDALPGWEEESWCAERRMEIPSDRRYALLVLDTRAAASRRAVRRLMEGARAALEPRGFLFLLCHNWWSPHGHPWSGGGTKDQPSANQAPVARSSPRWAARTLGRCGFPVVDHFLCFPGLRNPKEFVSPTSPFLEFPARQSWLHRVERWTGLLPLLHTSHLLLAGSQRWSDGPLGRAVRGSVGSSTATAGSDLVRISRFDIRRRGSLAMFLTDGGTGTTFIGRLATGSGRGDQVARNHEFLDSLHGLDELPPQCTDRIPRPVSVVERGGSTRIYLETLLPGMLAWKADWSRHGRVIRTEALEFLGAFGRALHRPVTLDGVALGRIFDRDRALLDRSRFLSTQDRKRLIHLLSWAADTLRGRTLPLVYGHGDFGVGNVLVDPRTGHLTGVIDWDTGREWDLPGVDRLNWEIQYHRMQDDLALDAAIGKVATKLSDEAQGGAGMLYPYTGSPEAELRAAILATCGIRYVCRDLQYPEIYRKLQPDISSGLAALESVTTAVVR